VSLLFVRCRFNSARRLSWRSAERSCDPDSISANCFMLICMNWTVSWRDSLTCFSTCFSSVESLIYNMTLATTTSAAMRMSNVVSNWSPLAK
jgi:hypothetical protein